MRQQVRDQGQRLAVRMAPRRSRKTSPGSSPRSISTFINASALYPPRETGFQLASHITL
jgi:hypothetical protein